MAVALAADKRAASGAGSSAFNGLSSTSAGAISSGEDETRFGQSTSVMLNLLQHKASASDMWPADPETNFGMMAC
jgi:hypothetical protein